MFSNIHQTPAQEFVIPEDWAKYYVDNVKVSKQKIEQLCEMTITQGQSSIWRQERRIRITASRAHKIIRAKSDHKRIEYFMDHKSLEHIKQIKRGIELEPVAFRKYQEVVGIHQLTKAGLVIKDQQFWLAASPDGIFKNSRGDICVLEIKCPEKIDVPWISRTGDLKETDAYYTQIQLTMYVCNAVCADLFVFVSDKDFRIVHVPFNKQFC